jgi:hypothetical protein
VRLLKRDRGVQQGQHQGQHQERQQEPAPAYAPRALPAQVAVMTMVRDEGPMLRRWVEHHAALVGLDNLVVLDDQTSDGSTDDLGCTVHRLPVLDGEMFEPIRMQLTSGLAAALLVVYDYVVFLDADELLVTSPEFDTLGDLLAARDYPEVVGAVGLNLVHAPGEAPLDLSRPLLEQRGFAVFTPLMCKPVLKRVAAPWVRASHGIRARYTIDPDLFLLHLKFADRDRLAEIAVRRNRAFQADGRAAESSWSRPVDEVTDALDVAIGRADLAGATPFDPRSAGLDSIVLERNGICRTPKQGQLQALLDNPVQHIPESLRGRA